MKALAALWGLAAFAALHVAAAVIAGRVDHALDDVYIHLAMAERLAAGGYGINPGQTAAAASSILYPALLTPAAGSEIQRLLPILWNGLAVVLAGLAWGAVLERGGWAEGARARFGKALALLGPIALGWSLSAFTGMENALHVAVTLGLLAGLVRFADTGRLGWLLPACVLLGPLLRYEGLGPSLAAAGVVFVLGRRAGGLALAALALAGPVALGAWLMAQGLAPLPASVMAKAGLSPGPAPWSLAAAALADPGVLWQPQGLPRLVLAMAGLAALAVAPVLLLARRRLGWLALAAAAVAAAHLAFGKFGWLGRYEGYALAFAIGTLVVLSGRLRWALLRAPAELALALVLVTTGALYGNQALTRGIWSPQAIWLQQGQMARIAREAVAGPVAVNDIGYVAWASPHPVLDLWGLASPQALALRRGDSAPGWAGPLAEAAGVEAAMIYDEWLASAIPEAWPRLGTLALKVPPGFAARRDVAIHAAPRGGPAERGDRGAGARSARRRGLAPGAGGGPQARRLPRRGRASPPRPPRRPPRPQARPTRRNPTLPRPRRRAPPTRRRSRAPWGPSRAPHDHARGLHALARAGADGYPGAQGAGCCGPAHARHARGPETGGADGHAGRLEGPRPEGAEGRRPRRADLGHGRGDRGQAALHGGGPGGAFASGLGPRPPALRARPAGDDVCRPALDAPAICRLLHRRGVERLLPPRAGGRAAGGQRGVRSGHPPRL